MKFLFYRLIIIFSSGITVMYGCEHRHEKGQIQDLIHKSLERGPYTSHTLLGIHFGDSHLTYLKKMDSLYEQGIVYQLIPDSAMSSGLDLSYYKYYYIFDNQEAMKNIKWFFSPVFKANRLAELTLLTNPVLEKSLMEKSLEPQKGILKNITDTSKAVMEDADLIYRITKTHLSQLYGKPEFVSKNGKTTYWFIGNCAISVNNNMTIVSVKFKNSKLK